MRAAVGRTERTNARKMQELGLVSAARTAFDLMLERYCKIRGFERVACVICFQT